MDDVAAEAGVTRQALYFHLSGRDELLRLVVQARLGEIHGGLRQVAAAADEFDEGLVDWILAALDVGTTDPELRNLAMTAKDFEVHEMYVGDDPAIRMAVADCIAPLLETGRRQGRLRADVETEAIVDWIRSVLLSLIYQPHLSEDERRQVVRTFVLPSLAT